MKKVITLETLSDQITTLSGDLNLLVKATYKGFQGVDRRLDGVDKRLDKIDERLDGIDDRLDTLEERTHGTELGINRIEMLHFKKIEHFENDMLKFRTELAKANIIKPNAPMHP